MNANGRRDQQDRVGYRLHGGVVQIATGATGCGDNPDWDWEDITTSNLIKVSELEFKVTTTAVGADDADDKIKIHNVTVTLVGQLKRDDNVTRRYTRTVRVRNNARGA